MFSYPLRAQTIDGDPYDFTLNDGFLMVDENRFVLDRKPGSPLLLKDTIQRGCDIPNVFAGSYVEYKEEYYLVSYFRGMVGRSKEGKLVYFDEPRDINVIYPTYKPEIVGYETMTSPKEYFYSVHGKHTPLSLFMGTHRGEILIRRGSERIAPKLVQEFAGVKLGGKKLYFGRDCYLHNGQIIYRNKNLSKGEKEE